MTRKYQKVILPALLIAGLSLAATVSAAPAFPNPLGGANFPTLINGLVTAISGLLVGLGTVMIFVAGILFLISAGNPKMVGMAKSALIYACLGILVGLCAASIVSFVDTIAGTGNDLPTLLTALAQYIGDFIEGLGVVMCIIAGIFYIFSFGDPERMKAARTTLVYAVIGIVVGLAAQSIVSFITGLAS